MAEGVRTSQRVLAVLSEAYLTSVYGRKEWETAFHQDPGGAIRKIIPIRVQDCPRPDLLTGVVSFDLFDLPADQARRTRLDNIHIALAGRAKPATEPQFPGVLIPPSSDARQSAGPAPVLPGTTPAVPRESPDTADDHPTRGAPQTASDLWRQLDDQRRTLGDNHPRTRATEDALRWLEQQGSRRPRARCGRV